MSDKWDYAEVHGRRVDNYGYAPGLGLCATCVEDNFRHDPDDPHAFHGESCGGVSNNPAITVVGGRALCPKHLIYRLEANIHD